MKSGFGGEDIPLFGLFGWVLLALFFFIFALYPRLWRSNIILFSVSFLYAPLLQIQNHPVTMIMYTNSDEEHRVSHTRTKDQVRFYLISPA